MVRMERWAPREPRGVHHATLSQYLRLSFIAPYARERFVQMAQGLYARVTTIWIEQESRPLVGPRKPHPPCPLLNFLNPPIAMANESGQSVLLVAVTFIPYECNGSKRTSGRQSKERQRECDPRLLSKGVNLVSCTNKGLPVMGCAVVSCPAAGVHTCTTQNLRTLACQ